MKVGHQSPAGPPAGVASRERPQHRILRDPKPGGDVGGTPSFLHIFGTFALVSAQREACHSLLSLNTTSSVRASGIIVRLSQAAAILCLALLLQSGHLFIVLFIHYLWPHTHTSTQMSSP